MLQKIIFLSFLFNFFICFHLNSLELYIKCKISNSENQISQNKIFTKLIDTKNRFILRESGLLFDEIISFTENEIHFQNDTYETYSLFDLSSNIWTIYTQKRIDIYRCER